MATYYWVGGTGTWDATTTTNWATSSGGTGGAGVPTSADNVIIDGSSGTGTIVLSTTNGVSVCYDLTVTATQAISLGGAVTQFLNTYGSLTYPATGSFTNSFAITMYANDANTKTITQNGKGFSTAMTFAGTGNFILGSAFSCANIFINGSPAIDVSASNYSISCFGWNNGGNNTFTINSRAGTINITGQTFNGAGKTYYNVVFTTTGGNVIITGANTFNNITCATKATSAVAAFVISANQTINGTLSIQSGNTDPTKRYIIRSDVFATQRTITAAAIDIQCCDFQDIVGAGTATWDDSTRSKYWGDCQGNSGITFSAGRTVYWNLSASRNWSDIGWATTNNGTPNAQYFPLAQDTATFTEAGAAGTVTINSFWQIGSIQMADGVSNRTTAFTFNAGAASIYGNVTLFSNLTLTGAGTFTFAGQSRTQTITSAGVGWSQSMSINVPNGTVKTQDALTIDSARTLTLTAGTLDLNNNTLTCGAFNSYTDTTRSIAFGIGNITVTGSNSIVWQMAIATGFTYTGTSTINCAYSGSTGNRTFLHGTVAGGTESNAVSVNVSNGSDNFRTSLDFNTSKLKNINFTGFSGLLTSLRSLIYGDCVFSSGMSIGANTITTTFAATSGTQQITTNGQTLDFLVAKDGAGTLQLQDALTLGATRTFTHTAGTVDLNGKTLTVPVAYSTSNSNVRSINFGSGGIISLPGSGTAFNATVATNLTTSGTGRIDMTSASAKTFVGGGASYPTLNQGGAGALTITGANTFQDITNTVAGTTVIFPAGVTTTVTNLSLAGASSTYSTATIPSNLSRLTIGGSSINSGREFNGTIKRIAYYPRRLSNATLSSLT